MEDMDFILSRKSLMCLTDYLDNFPLSRKSSQYFKDECLEKFSNKDQIVYRTLRKKIKKISSTKSITSLSNQFISCSENSVSSIAAACSVAVPVGDLFDEASYPEITLLKLKAKPLLTFSQLLENVKFAYNIDLLHNGSKDHILQRTLKEQEVLCLANSAEVLEINPFYTKSAAYKLCQLHHNVYTSIFDE